MDIVYEAILRLESQFLYYPDAVENLATKRRIFPKFYISHLFLGVDGTHIRFDEAPMKLTRYYRLSHYTNRKNYYSINAMIVANDQRIVVVDCTWPGSAHDL